MDIIGALAIEGNSRLKVEKLSLVGMDEYDVLIKNRAAGLCASDLGQLSGTKEGVKFPLLSGHEGSGVVLDVGKSVSNIKPGDHVATCALGECGNCSNCHSSNTNLCENRGFQGLAAAYQYSEHFQFDGKPIALTSPGASFASHTICNEAHVAVLPKEVPFEVACLLSCAVMTGVGSVMNAAKVKPGSKVVVFGLGGVGLNVVDGAQLAGAEQIIGIDLSLGKESVGYDFGMTDFICSADCENVVEQVRDLTGGGVDYAFECTGVKVLVQQAIESTRPEWGKVILVGIPSDSNIELNTRDIYTGRLLTGSYFGKVKGRTGLRQLADLFVEGKLHTNRLISDRLKLEQINDGFDAMRAGKASRSVIIF